ncbi:hypothetical protein ASF49_09210 [Methylobacterium sp. Leaf104]|uniref:hypothetical protein n=1 Tax=Methylobacterium TaxID=407 RepID=UPI0006F961E3|nr:MULTISPECIES: hypothetical protein [Methylobacterium]KQP31621.1 hypothetical protein ASF49_09210 [Methylobacterium sp. Leaf104]MCI9880518.1 hypothetical protein [Methylobacterium goesingense]
MNLAQSIRTQHPDESWSTLTGLPEDQLLETLGSNLRDVYDSMADAVQPSDLMRLAAMIDARRGQSDH